MSPKEEILQKLTEKYDTKFYVVPGEYDPNSFSPKEHIRWGKNFMTTTRLEELHSDIKIGCGMAGLDLGECKDYSEYAIKQIFSILSQQVDSVINHPSHSKSEQFIWEEHLKKENQNVV